MLSLSLKHNVPVEIPVPQGYHYITIGQINPAHEVESCTILINNSRVNYLKSNYVLAIDDESNNQRVIPLNYLLKVKITIQLTKEEAEVHKDKEFSILYTFSKSKLEAQEVKLHFFDQTCTFLKKNKPFIRKKYKANIQGVFGSYSRGEQGKESDLDILVRFDKDASLFTWGGLVNYLQEQLGIKVDIVSERALRDELKPYIEKDLVRV